MLPLSAPAFVRRISLTVMLALLLGSPAGAVTPSSPEVRELINKGLKYLEEANEQRLGGKCVIALAYLKSKKGQQRHPKVQEALQACRAAAGRDLRSLDMYSHGLAIIFLCEYDANGNRGLIDRYLNALEARQKPHGGWGYNTKPTGDTSQSQYAALSYWEAHNHNFKIKPESAARLSDWLIRTQAPEGAWGYQGHVAEGGKRVEQEKTGCSMLAAGMGGALICADMFGTLSGAGPSASAVPSALKVAGQKERKRAPSLQSNKFDRQALFKAIDDGNAWFDKNYVENIGRYNIYYLYSLERYKSFQEVLDGFSPDEPEWYQNGYEYLRGRQSGNGSWSAGCGGGPDTALAILFLVRSTKQLLKPQPLIDLRVGRRGLPKPSAKVELVGGELVVKQTEAALGDLLNLLDGDEADKLDALAENPDSLLVNGDIDAAAAKRLRQVVRSGSPAARLVATRTLARTGELDHVPTLIYALTDPDKRVTIQARDGLRFISRRFEGFGMPDNFSEEQRFNAVTSWKGWYLSIRPDAVITLK